jgi:carbon storage regulator CsrA
MTDPAKGRNEQRTIGHENGDSSMLVLSRKNQEAVVVGGTEGFAHMLTVTVLEIRGGSVKLGFELVPDVPVHHWEVWQQVDVIRHSAHPPKDSSHSST